VTAVTTLTPLDIADADAETKAEILKDSDAKPEIAAEAAPAATGESCFTRDNSLFCFKPDNAVRIKLQEIVDDTTPRGKIFDRIIMSTILMNSITLAIERPAIQDGSAERIALDVLGNIFGGIFSVEFIMKLIAWNFMYGPTDVNRKFKGPARYWDEGWNKLDGSLVMISWVDIILSNIPGLGGGAIVGLLKIFRILRALRPLRAVNKLPGLKLVVNCLLASLAPIGTTLIIVFTIFFIFGILGTQLFRGKMWWCNGVNDDDGNSLIPASQLEIRPMTGMDDCVYYDGFYMAGMEGNLTTIWTRQYYNFDNLGQSLLTLFVLSSIDGWVDIMYQGIDGVDEYMEPIEGYSDIMALYFIAFLLIGGFLILNMFVGVILENFNAAQEAEEERKRVAIANGEIIVEEVVKVEWVDPLDGEYWRTYGSFRQMVHGFVKSDLFDSITAAVIMSNVTIMAMEHYDPADWFKMFLKVQNYIFSFIFLIEFIIKQIAFGPCLYFGDNWCRFDFFLVLVSIFDLMTEFVDAALPVNPTILRVCRVMRIARVLRLMKGQWAEDLRKLLVTVANSLAQAGNLGLLLFLLYFINACLGIELFGRLACTDANPCEGMSDKANFEHFAIAILTLFRLSTGDNWNGILKDALRVPPKVTPCDFSIDCQSNCATNDNCCAGCDDSLDCKENCCASQYMSPMYFCFFILAAQFVMLNLVVAVLMKELGDANKADAAEQEKLAKEAAALEVGDAGDGGGGDDSSTSVEILRRSQAGATDGSRTGRRTFDETMKDGATYWKRRFSNARQPNNVMYDFPETDRDGKNVETIKVPIENEGTSTEMRPMQTGQTLPNTPDRLATEGAENAAEPERPPTRSAWPPQ